MINYNSSRYTLACINSIEKHTSPEISYHIVVVDNNSETDDFKNLLDIQDNPRVTLVRSKINLGFSAGNMYGVQFTTADYYFFLNNDCELQNDCLSILYTFCEQDPHVGMCAPQMYDGTGVPQRSFDYFPTLTSKILGTGFLRFLNPEKYPDKRKKYTGPLRVDMVSGSALFIRATAFNQIGGFDPTFFLYCEEEDLALRIRNAGHEVYLVPAAHNTHFSGSSTPKSYAIRQEFYISFLYFYNKHYGFAKTQIMKLLLFIRLFRKSLGSRQDLALAYFVLCNAPIKRSLRYIQHLRD